MTSPENEKQTRPLWEVIPSADYQLPLAPVTHSVRNRITAIQRLFRRNKPEETSPFTAKDTLRPLSHYQIEDIAPPQHWHTPALAIDKGLGEWLGRENPDQPVMVMIGPPGCGHTQMLRAWAKQHGWQIIHPPSAEQILDGDDTMLSRQMSRDTPWVFPVLEQAYVRHPEGLSLIRRFLDEAFSGTLGRGIIGCNSWAWAYLRYVWRGRVPTPFSLQACNTLDLAGHFQRLADPTGNRQILFRQSDNGLPILPPFNSGDTPKGTSNFLQFLATRSRGIFGVAWAAWRASLRTEPEAQIAENDESTEPNTAQQTVWVIPWTQLSFPELSSTAGRDEAFVLHSLLVHNGVDSKLLPTVLPLSPHQIQETLSRLQERGLVVLEETMWQVTALGYPAVRQFLHARGYLVDQF